MLSPVLDAGTEFQELSVEQTKLEVAEIVLFEVLRRQALSKGDCMDVRFAQLVPSRKDGREIWNEFTLLKRSPIDTSPPVEQRSFQQHGMRSLFRR